MIKHHHLAIVGIVAFALGLLVTYSGLTSNPQVSNANYGVYDATWYRLENHLLGTRAPIPQTCPNGTDILSQGPSIGFYPGTVNQYIDPNNGRQTDPDGQAGSHPSRSHTDIPFAYNIFSNDFGDKPLDYCKKRYPNTTSVAWGSWATLDFKAVGNVGSYPKCINTIKCIQPVSSTGYGYGYGYGFSKSYGYGFGYGYGGFSGRNEKKTPFFYIINGIEKLRPEIVGEHNKKYGSMVFQRRLTKENEIKGDYDHKDAWRKILRDIFNGSFLMHNIKQFKLDNMIAVDTLQGILNYLNEIKALRIKYPQQASVGTSSTSQTVTNLLGSSPAPSTPSTNTITTTPTTTTTTTTTSASAPSIPSINQPTALKVLMQERVNNFVTKLSDGDLNKGISLLQRLALILRLNIQNGNSNNTETFKTLLEVINETLAKLQQ